MLKKIWLMLASLLIGSAPPALSWGQDGNVRQQIEKVIRRSDDSLASKDIKAYMLSFADDYQGQDVAGNVYDKKQAEKNLTESFSNARSVHSRTQVRKVTLVNNEATVLSKEHTELEIVGRKTGKVNRLVFDGLWRSVWVNDKGNWQVRRQKQLSQTITQDGKSRVVKPQTSAKP